MNYMEEEQLKEKVENSENTENTPKIEIKPEWKDKKGWFQKGNKYGGLPKGKKHITTLVFQELKKKIKDADGKDTQTTYMDMFLKTIILKLTKDKDTQMIRHLWEMVDGKAKQEMEMDVKEKPTPIINNNVSNNHSIQQNSEVKDED